MRIKDLHEGEFLVSVEPSTAQDSQPPGALAENDPRASFVSHLGQALGRIG
jgi:hypothetical protein